MALSGGGDSLALLLLLADWARARKLAPPIALIVDHGLREGSARDARKAARWAKAAGLAAHVLTWKGLKPAADVEAAARMARYRLLGEWCAGHGIGFLYVAHTLEDQAETFLLRLARGSGLDGLSAMRPVAPFPLAGFEGLNVVRPLLATERTALRGYLAARDQDWLEDPMNGDPRYARVRLRRALPALAELGLTAGRVAAAAGHLARAREALDGEVEAWLRIGCKMGERRVLLDGNGFSALPEEVGLRVLARVLSRVSGRPYRPRFERLQRLYRDLSEGLGRARTLHGCRVGPAARRDAAFGQGTVTIEREARHGRG
ncbi:MAG TPA: tRNA lysidine(34) synthetase TilS [Rhizomicrobium sp.]|nr:tRNA lysidine(34) synthetase TilS [Rhizomicrobium sp.]